MKVREFIIEAKPENLGEQSFLQLSKAWNDKNDSDVSMDALSNTDNETIFGKAIADEIFKFIGPKNLIWAVKQYINDQYFFIHDLAEWQNTLTAFATITRSPRVQIERDINKYANIDQLRTAIETVSATPGNTGSGYFKKAIVRIDEMVQSGQAVWLYKGNDYVIYHPKTYEASRIMSALLTTNICTIMNNGHFDTYSKAGVLMYIIPNGEQDKLYNCFISKDANRKNSEFADEQNRHEFDLSWQLRHFPALLPLVKKATTPNTDISVKLLFVDNEDEKTKICMAAVQKDGKALRFVPVELRDYNICMAAVQQNGFALGYVPKELHDYDLCMTAVQKDGKALVFVPEELCDYDKIAMAAVNQTGYALQIVPRKLRDYDICMAAVQRDGWHWNLFRKNYRNITKSQWLLFKKMAMHCKLFQKNYVIMIYAWLLFNKMTMHCNMFQKNYKQRLKQHLMAIKNYQRG